MNDRQDSPNDVIQAAGGLVWRHSARGPEVVLIHRPRYDDWSFPKGKMEAGENWMETALREVEEETGIHVVLGDFAGSFSYLVRHRVKVVLFWNMQIGKESPFVANDEVDQLKWLPVDQAMALLQYGFERDLLRAVVQARWPDADLLD
ncbi:MAG: NUDIX hydrolase [Pirellulaceae bacterium]|nr:NUDIX hydrolase [Pirellulaceae bacterium]